MCDNCNRIIERNPLTVVRLIPDNPLGFPFTILYACSPECKKILEAKI